MLSGIGPAEHLKEHSIPVLVDAPGVGGNLQDHLTVMSTFRDASGMSINFIKSPAMFDKLRSFGSTLKWLISRDGTLTTNVSFPTAWQLDLI
jgi:choline dehydrogenase